MDFFHILNRGVEKRQTFMDDGDYIRFIHDMYVFNDTHSAPNSMIKERQRERKRDQLVHIHAFSLMPNHYHMLMSPVQEGGISLFMRKLNMGYAKYFNEKYSRSGVLWQGVFKKILIEHDAHFMYIPYYIHLNPLDLAYPEWRDGEVTNAVHVFSCLQKYRWSSYLDYTGTPNFQSVIYTPELSQILKSRRHQEREIASIVRNKSLTTQSNKLE